MLHCRYLNSLLITQSVCRRFPRFNFPLKAKSSFREFSHSRAVQSMEEPSELFEYTSGRWIYNDALRRSERRRVFNVSELKRLAAASVSQNVEDVARFEKLAEGGFNRTFLVTMNDGFQFVGPIPYPVTEPKGLVVASEVATMDFLRSHGIPVPKIYSYSTTSENAAGTEYVFMELIRGTNLGDIWFDMPEKARITIITKLVEFESRLFALRFPASGSLYYTKDLPDGSDKIDIPTSSSAGESRFCIGPDTTFRLWYGKRRNLQVFRGPYTYPAAALAAGAEKEIAYLKKFGRPLHPIQRLRREIYNYQKQSHLEHLDSLDKYLRIVHFLTPNGNDTLARPTIRHPDLQPNNVFVSDNLEITGLIDWQHCAILPLFVQCGIPNSFQNYGDRVSESLTLPALPENFRKMSDEEQFNQVMLLRRRQLHYFYVAKTAKLNSTHYDALTYDLSTLRRKLFHHASDPWEGDNVTLKADLIQLIKNWSKIAGPESSSSSGATPSCPIAFPEYEVSDCLRLNSAQAEADEQLEACKDVIGVGPEGWVPSDQYEEAKERASTLKEDALAAVESESEGARLREHWIFDDFNGGEYS